MCLVLTYSCRSMQRSAQRRDYNMLPFLQRALSAPPTCGAVACALPLNRISVLSLRPPPPPNPKTQTPKQHGR